MALLPLIRNNPATDWWIAILLIVMFFPAFLLSAAEPESPSHFTFAVPDYESRISLGIHNAEGRLVRRLAEMQPESEFVVGLNGLIAYWDGKDDAGNEVPPGKYEVSGFSVGATEAEGLSYAGNDWVEEFGATLPVTSILGLATGPGNLLILLGTLEDEKDVVFAYHLEEGLQWSRVLGESTAGMPWRMGSNALQWLAVTRGEGVELLDPATGELVARGRLPVSPVAVEVVGDQLQLFTGGHPVAINLLGFQEVKQPPLPSGLRSLSRFGEVDGGVDHEGRAWIRDGAAWTVFAPETGAFFGGLFFSPQGRLWTLVREGQGGTFRLGEFDREGDFLRQIDPSTFLGQPQAIVPGPDGESILILTRLPGRGSEVVGLRQGQTEEGPSWELFFQRAIHTESLKPPEGFRPLPLRMQLEVNSALGQGREATVFRLVVSREGAVQLTTLEGLALADLLQAGQILRAAAMTDPDQTAALRFWVLSPSWAEEFSVRHLDRITRLEIGTLTWPPESP